jgi:predicted dehydrogenase
MNLVAIGSPSGLHAEQGIAAARRGLHVLAEKPMDISTAGADALIAAAAEARVKLGVFFQDRFKTDLIKVKKSVDAGILGKLILADARVKWFSLAWDASIGRRRRLDQSGHSHRRSPALAVRRSFRGSGCAEDSNSQD